MNTETDAILFHLLTGIRTAALGTLRGGIPNVSMVLFAASPDFLSYYLHLSRLAQHTQDLIADARAGLMICEPDDHQRDPQTLARISLLGDVEQLAAGINGFPAARDTYLLKFPQSRANFMLGDFAIYKFQVRSARFVANFGKIFNLKPTDLRRVSGS
ncbi:MAG TPA: pyridoxamine 5'-phosphate oxidase family protein [Anaerolineaceae bacterium]